MRLESWLKVIEHEERLNDKLRSHIHRKVAELIILQKLLVIAEQTTLTLRRLFNEP